MSKRNKEYHELPTDGFNYCILCGDPSNGYAFCKDCYYTFDEDELIDMLNDYENEDDDVYIENTKCLICKSDSNGYHFCRDCYYKYKNKNLILQIKNCTETKVLESDYESKIKCEDGHPVKSQQEALIDNYLFSHNIRHVYEKEIHIDNNPEHSLHPDFYLPDLNVYIEHFGMTGNKKYEEMKKYKLPLYKKAKITLICTTNKDINNLSANLERKLKFFKKGEINYLDE